MADNAPLSVNRPPYPNVVNRLNRRVEQHVITYSYTAGTPALITTLCSGGITIADTAAGRITFTFPAGGTGAVGWIQACLPSMATPDPMHFTVDSDLVNFVTGSFELEVFADDADTTADDVTVVSHTLLVNVIIP
jgi:hypothetical protein